MSLESAVKAGVAVKMGTVEKIVDESGDVIELPFPVNVIIDGTRSTPFINVIKALCRYIESNREAVEIGKETLKKNNGGE